MLSIGAGGQLDIPHWLGQTIESLHVDFYINIDGSAYADVERLVQVSRLSRITTTH